MFIFFFFFSTFYFFLGFKTWVSLVSRPSQKGCGFPLDLTLQTILQRLEAMQINLWRQLRYWHTPFLTQPRSQGLSPLPPLSLGKETLVAAGHVNTQNLGGKKVCWTGWVGECFDCCYGKLCGFQNLEQPLLENCPLYQGLMWKFADEEMLHYFCCVQNIKDFRSKEIRQPNGA